MYPWGGGVVRVGRRMGNAKISYYVAGFHVSMGVGVFRVGGRAGGQGWARDG